jgi:TorA maturation chaperone TorD
MVVEIVETRNEQAAARHFARSAAYRLLSEATMYPSGDVMKALREEDLPQAQAAAEVLDESFSALLAAFAEELLKSSPDDLQLEHGRIFTHLLSLDCPPCETVYTAKEIFDETSQLSDIAGFFRAFGLELAERERPDHITVELEFMQMLTSKEAYAHLHHGAEKARLCRVVQRKFVEEHLGRWGRQFAQKLAAMAPDGVFGATASLLDAFLADEIAYLRAQPEVLVVNTDWRTKVSEDDCSSAECPLVESGDQDGNLIQL